MRFGSVAAPSDTLGLRVTRAPRTYVGERFGLLRSVLAGLPWFGVPAHINLWRLRNLPHLLAGVLKIAVSQLFGLGHPYGVLHLRVLRANGTIEDFGVASHLLITTAGVNKLVSLMNGVDAVTGAAFKFHAIGTGTVAPAIGDTALGTEATTQYAVANTRPTGSQTVGGSSNVYRTVGTNTVSAAYSPTELGVLSQAATGGTLLDRFTFTALVLASGDSLQSTVDVTLPAGS